MFFPALGVVLLRCTSSRQGIGGWIEATDSLLSPRARIEQKQLKEGIRVGERALYTETQVTLALLSKT